MTRSASDAWAASGIATAPSGEPAMDDPVTDALRSEAADEAADPRPSVVAAIGALGLRPGMRVLDAGCGAGAHLRLLAGAVGPNGSVVGVDLDPEALAVGADLCADLVATGRLRLEPGDLTALPLPTDDRDVAWSASVFHHLPDPAAALTELARVVRPGGLVAVLDGDGGGSFPFLPWSPELELARREAAVRAAADGYGGDLPYHFAPFLARRLPRLFREAGLTHVRLEAFPEIARAPLAPRQEAEVRSWLTDDRLRPYLAPRDRERMERLADPLSPDSFMTDPDFFFVRTSFLTVGRAA